MSRSAWSSAMRCAGSRTTDVMRSCSITGSGSRSGRSAPGSASRPARRSSARAALPAACGGCCRAKREARVTDGIGMTTRERVRRIVASDLRPVTPIFPPSRRGLVALPIALLVASLGAPRHGRRDDFEQLGVLMTWGLSALEWMLGVLVLGVAFRLAVPGYGASRRALWTIGAATIAWILTVTAVTYAAHATFVPRRGL